MKKILVAYDGTEPAEHVATHAKSTVIIAR